MKIKHLLLMALTFWGAAAGAQQSGGKAPQGRLIYCSYSESRPAGQGKDYCELIADNEDSVQVVVCRNEDSHFDRGSKQTFATDAAKARELQALLQTLKPWKFDGYNQDDKVPGAPTHRIYMEYSDGTKLNARWSTSKPKKEAQQAYLAIEHFFAPWRENRIPQNDKQARIKEIREKYAQAKEKMVQNGKNGQSPKDMKVVLNRMEDEEVYLYDMEELLFFFDETVEDNVVSKHPYLIIENWSNHGHTRYSEVLVDEKSRQVMFYFTHGETDGGFTVESRYYYDTLGRCIEQKHSTQNSWTDENSAKERAERWVKLFEQVTNNSHLTAQGSPDATPQTANKAERLSHIRAVYAQAKERMAENAKKEDPDELVITLHEFGDDRPPRTTVITFAITLQDCYFISSHATSMAGDSYSEYLFEPGSSHLIFSYCQAREEGEQYEWRYYYDENGACIETKSNTEDTDGGFGDKRTAKDLQAIYQLLTKDE